MAAAAAAAWRRALRVVAAGRLGTHAPRHLRPHLLFLSNMRLPEVAPRLAPLRLWMPRSCPRAVSLLLPPGVSAVALFLLLLLSLRALFLPPLRSLPLPLLQPLPPAVVVLQPQISPLL